MKKTCNNTIAAESAFILTCVPWEDDRYNSITKLPYIS
jgi:hypothetical protein